MTAIFNLVLEFSKFFILDLIDIVMLLLHLFFFLFKLFVNMMVRNIERCISSLRTCLDVINLRFFLLYQRIIWLGFRLHLFINEFGIESIGKILNELLVVSLLDDLALLHDNYIVSISNCGETMCNYDSCDRAKIMSNVINSSLNFFLVFLI